MIFDTGNDISTRVERIYCLSVEDKRGAKEQAKGMEKRPRKVNDTRSGRMGDIG